MKTTNFLSVLFLGQALLFASCNQCYECEKYQYCFTVHADCGAAGSTTAGPFCEDSEAERQAAEAEMLASYPQGLCTVTIASESENLIPGNQQEVCGSKKDATDSADDLEVQGYKCTKE